jgi:hypothetical protein
MAFEASSVPLSLTITFGFAAPRRAADDDVGNISHN